MSISGTYEGKVNSPVGATPLTLVFEENGTVLTGSVISRQGEETPICEGEINGTDFSFSFDMKMGVSKTRVQLKGTINADDLNGFLTTPLGTVSVIAKRI
jgi:hypothetical protein